MKGQLNLSEVSFVSLAPHTSQTFIPREGHSLELEGRIWPAGHIFTSFS